MMQVEDKPDVTYADIGGCKEQIEKIREVVEMPMLEVCCFFLHYHTFNSFANVFNSPKGLLSWGLTHQKVFFFMDHQEPERHSVQEQ